MNAPNTDLPPPDNPKEFYLICPRCAHPIRQTENELVSTFCIAKPNFHRPCPYCYREFDWKHDVLRLGEHIDGFISLLSRSLCDSKECNHTYTVNNHAGTSSREASERVLDDISHPIVIPPASPSETKPLKKGLAIASLVCGIIGGWASTFSLAAVICGHISLNNINNDPDKYGGKGLTIAGLALGYLGIVLAIILGTMKGFLNNSLRQMGF